MGFPDFKRVLKPIEHFSEISKIYVKKGIFFQVLPVHLNVGGDIPTTSNKEVFNNLYIYIKIM